MFFFNYHRHHVRKIQISAWRSNRENCSLALREKVPAMRCGIAIGLFSDTRVFIKSRSQSPRFQGTTDKKPSRGSTSLNVHQKCMGFPRPIPQPEKGLFPSCGGPLRGAVKSETKSEIRRSSAHMCNPHGDTYASTVPIQFIYISPSTDIPLERSLSWFYRSISCRCVSPATFLLFSPVLFFFFLTRPEKNHARGMHSQRANCARAKRRFSQIRFFNANVTLTPSSDDSIK